MQLQLDLNDSLRLFLLEHSGKKPIKWIREQLQITAPTLRKLSRLTGVKLVDPRKEAMQSKIDFIKSHKDWYLSDLSKETKLPYYYILQIMEALNISPKYKHNKAEIVNESGFFKWENKCVITGFTFDTND